MWGKGVGLFVCFTAERAYVRVWLATFLWQEAHAAFFVVAAKGWVVLCLDTKQNWKGKEGDTNGF